VFGGSDGGFTEADGTMYRSSGNGTGTATGTFASGTLEAGGLTLTIEGTVERTYTLEAFGA
jgi:hypothetical protein